MMVNRQTIEDAGVGPMTPLAEEDNRASEERDSRPEVDGGEETETAPEADDEVGKSRQKPPQKQHKKKLIQKHHKKKFIQKHHLEDTETLPLPSDDSVTRCICEFQHDDGYMICCDKCAVWQHVVCMGLDRNNIPEEYLCEKCSPRQVDKKRARMVQARREREIFNNAGSSDDDGKRSVLPGMSGLPGHSLSGLGKPKKGPLPGARKGPGGKKLMKSSTILDRGGEGLKAKGTKKNYKRRVFSKDGSTKGEGMGGKKLSPRKARRKSTSATDTERDEEKTDDPAMMLRSWIDTYEEAVTNHYSQELRSRLERIKVPATCQVKPKDVTGDRCNVSLRGNGMKVLTANSHIPANTPITEFRGKYMMPSQYRDSDGAIKSPVNMPFVLLHRLCPDLEVCVDSKTYGNNSRFCRRSNQMSPMTSHNAEVRHHLDKGSLHLYIVSCCIIEKNQEIILPPEPKNGFLPPLSINDELREINKANGLPPDDSGGGGPGGGGERQQRKVPSKAGVNKRRLKREAKKFAPPPTSSSDEERESTPPSPRKTRQRGGGASTREGVKEEVVVKKEEKVDVVDDDKVLPPPEPMDQDVKVNVVEPSEVVHPPKEEPEDTKPEEESILETVQVKKSGDNKPVVPPKPVEITPLTSKLQQNPVPQLTLDIKEPSSPEKRSEPSPGSGGGNNPNIKSPGKLGLPDSSGLIVGVNTIDYDVSIRNKAQTREEKKMEMIMKAIEQMERAEARKRQEGEFGISDGQSRPAKRRRSNSTAKNKDNADSALDASSADEANIDSKTLSSRQGRRRRAGPSAQAPQRRRSRAKSGDSQSAEISADEAGVTSVEGAQSADLGVEAHQEFRFPKHKKHMVAEYLGGNADRYETVAKKIVHIIKNDPTNFSSEGLEDDVSSNYLRGSRSPPGIANHLLRSTSNTAIPAPPKSPVKSSMGCSAKKRWLRAAMSEDHSEVMVNGGSEPGGCSPAPISPEPSDHYTPLKKRRLASYKESGEDSPTPPPDISAGLSAATMADKFVKGLPLPNGLKKRLISNLVIDSVLDKALDDMCPEINNKSKDLNSVEDDKAGVKNCFTMDMKKTVQDNLEDVIKNEIKQELESEEISLKMEAEEAKSPLGKKQKGGMKKKKGVEKKEGLDSLFVKKDTSEPSKEQDVIKGATNNQIKIEPSESKDNKCAKSSEKVPKTKGGDNWGHLNNKFPKEELDIKQEIADEKPAATGDIKKSEKSRETGEKVSIKDLVTVDNKVSIKSEKIEECKAAPAKLHSTTTNKHVFNHSKVEQKEDTKKMFNNKDSTSKFSHKSKEVSPPKPSEVINNKIADKLKDKVSEVVVGDMTPSDASKPKKVQSSTDRSQEKVEKPTTARKEPSPKAPEPMPRASEPSPKVLEPSPRAVESTPKAPEPQARVPEPTASIPEPPAKLPEVKLPEPAQHSVFKSFFSTELSVEEIDRQLETKREQLARESSLTPLSPRPDSLASSDSNSRPPSAASPHTAPHSHATPPPTRVTPPPHDTGAPFPPKEKKRMSLADYKKRKQISVSEAPSQYPERGERRVSPLDEVFHSDKPVSLPVLPGLEPYRHSDNPVLMTQLEKLEKLEKEHKENKMKARHHHRPESSSNRSSAPAPRSSDTFIPRAAPPPPVLAPDRPREDLTERLRKEFGLDVDESEEEKSGDEERPIKLNFGGFSSRDSSSSKSFESSKSVVNPLPVPAPQREGAQQQPQRRTSQESSRESRDYDKHRDSSSSSKARRNNSYQRSNYAS